MDRKTQASTHRSAKPHTGTFCDLWLWPLTFWPQNKWFPGLVVEHLFVMFRDLSCVGFWDIMRINKHTNQRRKPTPAATALGVGNERTPYSNRNVLFSFHRLHASSLNSLSRMRPVRRKIDGYLPSHRTSPPDDWYQIILATGTTTCLESLQKPRHVRPRVEPARRRRATARPVWDWLPSFFRFEAVATCLEVSLCFWTPCMWASSFLVRVHGRTQCLC